MLTVTSGVVEDYILNLETATGAFANGHLLILILFYNLFNSIKHTVLFFFKTHSMVRKRLVAKKIVFNINIGPCITVFIQFLYVFYFFGALIVRPILPIKGIFLNISNIL